MPTQIAVPTSIATTPAANAKTRFDDGAAGSRKELKASVETEELELEEGSWGIGVCPTPSKVAAVATVKGVSAGRTTG
jgi:hypothetical protein